MIDNQIHTTAEAITAATRFKLSIPGISDEQILKLMEPTLAELLYLAAIHIPTEEVRKRQRVKTGDGWCARAGIIRAEYYGTELRKWKASKYKTSATLKEADDDKKYRFKECYLRLQTGRYEVPKSERQIRRILEGHATSVWSPHSTA